MRSRVGYLERRISLSETRLQSAVGAPDATILDPEEALIAREEGAVGSMDQEQASRIDQVEHLLSLVVPVRGSTPRERVRLYRLRRHSGLLGVNGELAKNWLPTALRSEVVQDHLSRLHRPPHLHQSIPLDGTTRFLQEVRRFDDVTAHRLVEREWPSLEGYLRKLVVRSEARVTPRQLLDLESLVRHHAWTLGRLEFRSWFATEVATRVANDRRADRKLVPGMPIGADWALTLAEGSFYTDLLATGNATRFTEQVERSPVNDWTSKHSVAWQTSDWRTQALLHRAHAKAMWKHALARPVGRSGLHESAVRYWKRALEASEHARWDAFTTGILGDYSFFVPPSVHAQPFHVQILARAARGDSPRRLLVEAIRHSAVLRQQDQFGEASQCIVQAREHCAALLKCSTFEQKLSNELETESQRVADRDRTAIDQNATFSFLT